MSAEGRGVEHAPSLVDVLASFNGFVALFRLPILLARAALHCAARSSLPGPLPSCLPWVGHNDFAPVAAIKSHARQAVMPLEACAPSASPDSARNTPAVTAFRSAPLSGGPAGFVSRG